MKTISLKKVSAVAVASLGFGLLSVVPANAEVLAGTSTVAPVRVSFVGATQDLVNGAAVTLATTSASWTDDDLPSGGGTLTITTSTAPSAAAVITIASTLFEATTDTTVTLLDDGVLTDTNADVDTSAESLANGLTFKADTAGTYAGKIVIADAGGADSLSIPFSFTTTGAVASYTFTSDVASSAVSGAVTSTVTLLDAAGKTTQASTADTFALTVAIAGTATVGTLAAASASAADLTDGVHANVYTNSVTAASTSTLTATPQGTLGTLAAKTLTITTVAANTGVPTATITTSNVAIKSSSSTSSLNKYTVSVNATTVTFNVTGLTPNTSVSYTVTSSTTTTASVNGATAANLSGSPATVVSVSSATGTLAVTVKATTPAAQTFTLDLNNAATADVTGQVNADFTYATGAFTAKVTTPAAASLNKTSAAITYTGTVADQFGNPLAGATVTATGTQTPATSPTTITATAVTAADGTYTVTLAAAAAATTSMSTVISATGTASIASASANVAYFTATGIAATLVLTDTDTAGGAATTDNKSTRVIPKTIATGANDSLVDLIDADVANTDNQVSITPQTTSPGTIGYTVTATNGIRLSTSNMDGALVTGTSITGTGGTAFFAVPTKVGDGVITVVSGGLTQTFTLTGVLPAQRANLVTLTAEATAGSYTVTTTDAFGNGVAATVAITVTGPGEFSNGFKNLSVTTAAVTGKNTFSIVSDGSASTVISASIAGDANYTAITSTEVTTYGLVAASAVTTSTLTGKGGNSGSATLAGITAMIDALNAKIVALNALIAKIMRKLGVK